MNEIRKNKNLFLEKELITISERIHGIADIDILLDKLLFELKKITNAEGGTIFLIEDNTLKIKYIYNDYLFSKNKLTKYLYYDKSVPISRESIAGSSVVNGQIIMVDDVYNIKEQECNCSFNKKFDENTGYRTKSIIAIPLKTIGNKIVGVIQLINARDENGKIKPFQETDKICAQFLANEAAIAIEKAKITRAMIEKILKMVEFRDPKETGAHVNRIGFFSVEIYHKWAENRGLPEELIRRFNDKLKIAAMLHDVGKIGISDTILKKQGPLTENELKIMRMHTIYGYRLFKDGDSELENLIAQIALNHHERWDGGGYPGYIEDIDTIEYIERPGGKKEKDIPLAARIVTLSDVYDALCFKRSYKEAWSEEEVINYIKENKGKLFEPEIVDCFFEIYDIIKQIKNKIIN